MTLVISRDFETKFPIIEIKDSIRNPGIVIFIEEFRRRKIVRETLDNF